MRGFAQQVRDLAKDDPEVCDPDKIIMEGTVLKETVNEIESRVAHNGLRNVFITNIMLTHLHGWHLVVQHMQTAANTCKHMQTPVRACKHLDFCTPLHTSADSHRYANSSVKALIHEFILRHPEFRLSTFVDPTPPCVILYSECLLCIMV